MTMLRDFFSAIKEHFTDQARVVPVVLEGLSPGKRKKLYWDPGIKKVVEAVSDRPDNAHKLLSVESVIAYVHAINPVNRINIWINPGAITVECEENDPKDIVSMPLVFSPLFQLLSKLRVVPSIPQTTAIKMLRQQLAAFDVGAKALTSARNLKISTGDDFESDQSHIANRVGKSIMQQASGAGELPEFIDVVTQVYLKGGSTGYKVRVWMSVDFAKKGNLLLEPDEAQMEEAMLLELAEIFGELAEALKKEPVSIYEGEYCVS